MKVIQITDTHFSPSKTHFNSNWAPLLAWLETEKPNLIIHTGDLTVDGADHADDMTFCMELMRQAPAPVLIVPEIMMSATCGDHHSRLHKHVLIAGSASSVQIVSLAISTAGG